MTKNIYNGNLEIRTQADAEKWRDLTEVTGDLSINGSTKLDAPLLYPAGFDKFQVLDKIACVVTSMKEKDGFTILSCRHSKIKDQKIVGDKFYVAQKDGHNAHATTIQEALRELQFKIVDRDVSQYRNMPKDTKKSVEDWAFVYRVVTGACRFGTEHFIKSQGKLKKSYTLDEIISLTRGQFGHDSFVKTVSPKAAKVA